MKLKLFLFVIFVFLLPYLSQSCENTFTCPTLNQTCTNQCSAGLFCNQSSICQEYEKCDSSLGLAGDTCSQNGYMCVSNVCLPFIGTQGLSTPCKSDSNCIMSSCISNTCTTPPVFQCSTSSQWSCPLNQYCVTIGGGGGTSLPSTSIMSMTNIMTMTGPIGPGTISQCSNRLQINSICTTSDSCERGLACINGICSPIFSGTENATCFYGTVEPTKSSCEIGLSCLNGGNGYICKRYVEKQSCDPSDNYPNCNLDYQSCACRSNGNGTCQSYYKLTQECKDSAKKLVECAKSHGSLPSYTDYLTQTSCQAQLCNYSRDCIDPKSKVSTCFNDLFLMCPSNYQEPQIDSSSSSSSSSSSGPSNNSSSSSESSLSSSVSSESSSGLSSSESSNSSNSTSSHSEVSSSSSSSHHVNTTSTPSNHTSSSHDLDNPSSSTILSIPKLLILFVSIILYCCF
ncbi:hypothetical protein ACTA71_002551 [Dictyostelium dimigraforme]